MHENEWKSFYVRKVIIKKEFAKIRQFLLSNKELQLNQYLAEIDQNLREAFEIDILADFDDFLKFYNDFYSQEIS